MYSSGTPLDMTIHLSTSAVAKLVGSQPHFWSHDLSSITVPQGHNPNFGNFSSGSVKSDTSRIIFSAGAMFVYAPEQHDYPEVQVQTCFFAHL